MTDRNEELLMLASPWYNNENAIWLASNISLRRNIEKFKFPGKMGLDRRRQILQLVSKEFLTSNFLKIPSFIKGEEVGPLEKEFLVEHFLSDESFLQAHQGEAFVVDQTGEFLAVLNLKDHIHMQMVDIKGELEGAWNRIVKIENELSRSITYSYSPQFGFLTAEALDCGTALNVSLFLQLSGLVHTQQLPSLLESLQDDAIHVTPFLGRQQTPVGDIYIVSNHYTLGINEETILSSLRSFATKLQAQESSVRQKISQEESAEMKDKVARAYGILIHSYQIEAQEALDAISLLKLGQEFKWVKGITLKKLNELFFNCRRSHLLRLYPDKISQDQIPHKRSEFIHKTLMGVTLEI